MFFGGLLCNFINVCLVSYSVVITVLYKGRVYIFEDYCFVMLEILFYVDSYYDDVVFILQEANLFDPVWESKESLHKKITRDSESILVAKLGDELVGCIFIMEDGWNAFLWRLAVKKSHRKEGIGRALMARAEDILKHRDVREISFFVDPKNDSLKDWYDKQGYQTGHDWTFMFKKC